VSFESSYCSNHSSFLRSTAFPAAFIDGPFYDSGRPLSQNYGSIGLIAGHEITHGFDTHGSQFAANGSLNNWWSESARKIFEEKAKCFEEQYSSITDVITGRKVNGKNTLEENISDNGGLHVAFEAYKKLNVSSNQGLLPGLSKFNHDQLFFLGHANAWCLNIQPKLYDMSHDSKHAAPRHRVNVPLQNSPNFAEAFKCMKGSKMNPEKQCHLW
jgi:predicted metalloendopeptidase